MKKLILAATFFCTLWSHADIQGTTLPILVVSGMKIEAVVVTGPGIINLISAANATQLRDGLKQYNSTNIRGVISFGIAGGLSPALQPGQMIVPDTVVSEKTRWSTDAALVAQLTAALNKAGINVLGGTLVGTDTLGVTPADRAALRLAEGGDSVDMESHIVAEFAAANGLPFGVLRAIADPSTYTFPPAAQIPLLPDGTVDLAAVQASLKNDSSQLPALMELNKDTQTAIATLKNCQSADNVGDLQF